MPTNDPDPAWRTHLQPWTAALFTAGLTLTALGVHLRRISPHRLLSTGVLALGVLAAISASAALANQSGSGIRRVVSLASKRSDLRPLQLVSMFAGFACSVAARAAAGDGMQTHSPLAIPLWLAGMALTIAGVWKHEGASQAPWPSWERALLLCLLTIALVFRMSGVAEMPYVLSGDEGSAGLSAVEFLDGRRTNLLASAWFSFPALYFGLLSLAQRLSGTGVFAIRAVSALAGALCVPALYAFLRIAINRRTALMASIWLAAFHHHIFFSRLAYNNIFDSLFFILAWAGLWASVEQRTRHSWILFGAALGFGQYFYTTSRITLAASVLTLVLLGIFRRERRPDSMSLLAALGVFLSVSLPLLLHYAANPTLLTFTASRVSMLIPGWTAEAAAAFGMTSTGLVLEQIWITILGLTTAELQGVYFAPGVPLLFGLSLPIFLAGAALAVFRWKDDRLWLPGLVFAGTVLAGGLSIQAPNAQRMLLLPPLLALLITLPLEFSIRLIQRRTPALTAAATAVSFALVFTMAAQNLTQLFLVYFPEERYGSLNGEVAYEISHLLDRIQRPDEIYFIGGDRMNFSSIPSITYLHPDVTAVDLAPPYGFPMDSDPAASRLIIILPGQTEAVREFSNRDAFPHMKIRYNRDGEPLFVYLLEPRD